VATLAEILNNAQVTPHRLHAFARLVARLPNSTYQELLDLLQPAILDDKQSAAGEVYKGAKLCGLIEESTGRERRVSLLVSPAEIETVVAFRQCMQRLMLNITQENQDNYLFNIFTAWYAVQNERIFQLMTGGNLEIRFNDEMFPGNKDRAFNETKFNGWRNWANFLGFGWPLKPSVSGQRELLVPEAYERLKDALPALITKEEGRLQFGSFLRRLGEKCPELDGGKLFESCRQKSRPMEEQRNILSLMLSTALRSLRDAQVIELIKQGDANENWQLYQAEGLESSLFSHIRLGQKGF
jgi:hypothetical protein